MGIESGARASGRLALVIATVLTNAGSDLVFQHLERTRGQILYFNILEMLKYKI